MTRPPSPTSTRNSSVDLGRAIRRTPGRGVTIAIANTYLVGAPKAGTTSVATWLERHPEIFWSVPKEPFFWASDLPAQRDLYGFNTRSAYETLYSSAAAKAAKVRGDGSTTYLYSTTAVPDILQADPDAKFIVCLRNPSDLVVSYHRTQLLALNEDEPSFCRAWRRSLSGGQPGLQPLHPMLVDYPFIGRIGHATERLAKIVPRRQWTAVFFEDLVADPAETFRQLLTFLDVDPDVEVDLSVENASDRMYRSGTLRRLTHRPPTVVAPTIARLRQWSRTTRLPLVAALKAQMWRDEGRPQVSDSVRAELREYFATDVRQLELLLGKDISGWRR